MEQPMSPPGSPLESRHSSEAVISVNSRRKSTAGGAQIHGDFIRAKTVQDSGEFKSNVGFYDKSRRCAKRFTMNTWVNQFMALVVLFDAYCNCRDIDARADGQVVPQFISMGSGFCLMLYSIELVLVFLAQGWNAMKDWVFVLDLGVIVCGFTEITMDVFMPEGELADRIGILRLLRLGRVIRLLQLLRKTRALRELQKLVTMMSTCLKALAWSFIFCFVVMTIWAMLIVELVNPLIQEMHSNSTIFADCPQCLRATHSVMDANLLLFKTVIAGDSWGTIAVPVIEAYPATAVIWVGSLLTLVFGVLNLIVAVADLVQLFDMIDTDGSGFIEPNEFIKPLSRWVHDSKTAPRFIKYNMLRIMQEQQELQAKQEELRKSVEKNFTEMARRMVRPPPGPVYEDSLGETEALESLQACDSTFGLAEFGKVDSLNTEAPERPRQSQPVMLPPKATGLEAELQVALGRLEEILKLAVESAIKDSTGVVREALRELKLKEVHICQEPPPSRKDVFPGLQLTAPVRTGSTTNLSTARAMPTEPLQAAVSGSRIAKPHVS